jgi:hypothetical protein
MTRRFWISLLAVLALAACTDDPTSPPDPGAASPAVVYRALTPMTAQWFGCTEFLDVEGWQREVMSETVTPDGQTQLRFHYDKFGTAVGSFSGRRYVFNESSHFITTSSAPGSTFTLPMSIRLIGQGDAPDMHLHWIMHVTVNANGEITSSLSDGTSECRA